VAQLDQDGDASIRSVMVRVVCLRWDRLMRRRMDDAAQAGPKKKVSVRGAIAKRTRSKQP
jgi:hypothetical protein